MHDVTWIGSSFFTDTGGYYDTYRSSTPRDAWPYDAPRCGAGAGGQRWRLPDLQAVVGRWQQWPARAPAGAGGPDLLNRLAGWAGFLSRAEVDDSVIRAIASPRQQK
jgi:hypothetical protein